MGQENREPKTAEQEKQIQHKRHRNGGYTHSAQPQGRRKQGGGGSGEKGKGSPKDRHSNGGRSRKSGYQPDNSKEAIRTFLLGDHSEEGMRYEFFFDRGTYLILKRPEPEEVPEGAGDEGTGEKAAAPEQETAPVLPEEKKEGPDEKAEEEKPKDNGVHIPPDAEELLCTKDKAQAYLMWRGIKYKREKAGRPYGRKRPQ